VDLWEDDLHENGQSQARSRVYVGKDFWIALIRIFVRVDGVMARVIDSRYQWSMDSPKELKRETSWREGTWSDLVGINPSVPGDPCGDERCFSLEMVTDHMAAKKLPLTSPPVTMSMILDRSPGEDTASLMGEISSAMPEDPSWELPVACDALSVVPFPASLCGGIVAVAVVEGGLGIVAWDRRGRTVWSKPFEPHGSPPPGDLLPQASLSISLSPSPECGGRILLGDDRGEAHVWRLVDGERLLRFDVVTPNLMNPESLSLSSGGRGGGHPKPRHAPSQVTSAKRWVEALAWSDDGNLASAAAGRSSVIFDLSEGMVVARHESPTGTVVGLDYRCGNQGGPGSLAIGAYGCVEWLSSASSGGGGGAPPKP